MNGKDLYYNLIDELERATVYISEFKRDFPNMFLEGDAYDELITDINADLERCYDNQDTLCEVLQNVEIEYE